MGWLNTLREALGLRKPVQAGELLPAKVSMAAERALETLARDKGLVLLASPVPEGHVIRAEVKAATEDDFAAAFDGLPIVADAETLERMRGLTLGYQQGRWVMQLQMDIRATETPNPNSRSYQLSLPLMDGRAFFGTSSRRTVPEVVQSLLDRDDVQCALLAGHRLTIERTPGAPWPAIDQAVAAAVRTHFLYCRGTLIAEKLPQSDDPLEEAVRKVLEDRILPGIHADGGDLELVEIDEGTVRVHLVGACRTCPASAVTLHHGVERILKEAFPGEILSVEQI